MRLCLADCGRLAEPGDNRCAACQRQRQRQADARRGSRTDRGYGRDHQHRRKAWQPLVEHGSVDCARCRQRIAPDQPWDLGHTDDRTIWTGPEHQHCNRSAAGIAGNATRVGGTPEMI